MDRKRQVTFNLSEAHIARLKLEADKGGESISSMVRRIVVLYMNNELVTRKEMQGAVLAEKIRNEDLKDVY